MYIFFVALHIAVHAALLVGTDSVFAMAATFCVLLVLAVSCAPDRTTAESRKLFGLLRPYYAVAYSLYAMGMISGAGLVGYFYASAGYTSFAWYAIPVSCAIVAEFILRAGERAGKEAQLVVAAS